MKHTYFTLTALSFTFLFSCTNSDNNSEKFNNTSQTISDTLSKTTSTSLNNEAANFLVNAEISKLTLVELSDKLMQAGTSQELTAFVKKLIEDQKANHKLLENLAVKKDVKLPQNLPLSKTQLVKQLENTKKEGKNEFYLKAIINDYQKTIDLFTQATKLKDADVAAFAEITKPTLENHYQEIIKMEKKIMEAKAGQGNDPL
ncbi:MULTISPECIES: DUF4142 domain-containing protein [Pedobacter]|uniref:DUF4142 domain-containing protein n=1 Tax=Pedobacter TaxID=84567 RepID=UPI001E398655|nr:MULTISPECIES: DUF4142 domain-containing protein [Pedobacter]